MTKAQTIFAKYQESHRHPTNKIFHHICVPLIVVSLIGILWPLKFPLDFFHPYSELINGGTALAVFSLFYYLQLSKKVFTGLFPFVAFSLVINYWLSFLGIMHLYLSIAVFILSWVGQFIGHHVEGKKPSFFEDLQFFLIGPAWVLNHFYEKLGWSMVKVDD